MGIVVRKLDRVDRCTREDQQIGERRSFDSEPLNNDRSPPAFSAVVGKIDDELQLMAGNLRRAFPAAGGAFRRLAKRGGSKQDCSE